MALAVGCDAQRSHALKPQHELKYLPKVRFEALWGPRLGTRIHDSSESERGFCVLPVGTTCCIGSLWPRFVPPLYTGCGTCLFRLQRMKPPHVMRVSLDASVPN